MKRLSFPKVSWLRTIAKTHGEEDDYQVIPYDSSSKRSKKRRRRRRRINKLHSNPVTIWFKNPQHYYYANKASSLTENEKDKEIKETSEAESYEDYENEAMENAEEGLDHEEISLSENSLPSDTHQSARSISVLKCETGLEEILKGKDSYEERRNLLLKEKWFTVTGKKPRNIPTVKKHFDERTSGVICFGDRKPADVESLRKKKMLVASGKVRAVGLRYGKIRQEIRISSMNRGIMCFTFAPNASSMVSSDRNGGVQVRKFITGEEITFLKTMEQVEKLPVRALKYFPTNNDMLYIGGESGVIQIFDINSGKLLSSSSSLSTINTLDINADGTFLATGGRSGKINVVNPLTLEVIWTKMCPKINEKTPPTIDDEYHKLRIYALKFHPNETNLFATGGWDNDVKVWDVRTSNAVRSIRGPTIHGDGLDILNNKILTASWRVENSLSIWDFTSGKLIKDIPIKSKSTKYEGEFLYTGRFIQSHPDFPPVQNSLIAVGGSGFSEAIVIDIDTEEVVEYFPSFKAILVLDVIGNLIAYGGKESIFRVVEVSEKHLSRRLRK